MYGMFQTAFRPSCINRAWVFEWHKRFKEGRESVGDDERCVKSKQVNRPELIGQIKNFMDKDCRVSTETISAQFDVSVGTVDTIIREELKMRKICTKFVPRVLRDALVTCDESWIYCYDPESKRQSSQWKHADSPRPKKAKQSKSTHKLLMIPFLIAWGWSICTGFPQKRTSMGPSRSCWNSTTSALQPEEITSKRTRASWVYYQ